MAPLNSKSAKEKLEKQVELAVENGAKVYYGNEKVDLPGQFFMPTILTDITPDNPIFDQEMFGPVASVYKVNSEEEAIALANNSSYGLGNTVFGEPEHAARVAAKIETGMSWINSGWASLPELPFGGVKNSGYGRELSELGFNAFVYSGWASLPELPFGGVKNSGYGRELSELGFNAFVNEHLVFEPKR